MIFPHPNGEIKLEESTHKYILTGHENIAFTSVTTCISEFFTKFDKEAVAYKLVTTIPKYKGRSAEDLIKEWEESANYGTAVHKEIEDYIKKEADEFCNFCARLYTEMSHLFEKFKAGN